MDKIERDIYVCRGTVPDPIEYPEGTNAIPLIFYLRDYTIPENAEVKFYMKKPSGAEIYDDGTYEGNTVTITMTTQMSAEPGKMMATVRIIKGNAILNTFNIPVFVMRTAFSDNAIQSKDEFTALDKAIEAAGNALENVRVNGVEAEVTDHVADITVITMDEVREQIAADTDNTLVGVSLNGEMQDVVNRIAYLITPTMDEIQAEIASQIAEIVAGAPASLDTLKEIADWIENHADDAAAMNKAINENTEAITEITARLAQAIADGITGIKVNGVMQTVVDNVVDISVPTEADIDEKIAAQTENTLTGVRVNGVDADVSDRVALLNVIDAAYEESTETLVIE